MPSAFVTVFRLSRWRIPCSVNRLERNRSNNMSHIPVVNPVSVGVEASLTESIQFASLKDLERKERALQAVLPIRVRTCIAAK
jgi:hypothetical protein